MKAKFYKEQLESKVKELKEEIAYTENHWSEELDSCRKQCSEANQQKIHVSTCNPNNDMRYVLSRVVCYITRTDT